MKSMYEYFKDTIEYPSDDELLNGVPMGVDYNYVSNTYLNGFINYVNIVGAYMMRRYSDEDKWEEQCKNVDDLKDSPHTNVRNSDKFDDILILAKSTDSYWLFWNDCDCPDCCLGRLSIDTFTDEEALESLKCLIINDLSDYSETTDSKDMYMKFIPKEYFRGWITL